MTCLYKSVYKPWQAFTLAAQRCHVAVHVSTTSLDAYRKCPWRHRWRSSCSAATTTMGRRSTTIAPPITPFPSFPPTASKRTRTHKQSFLVPPRDVVLVFSCVHFLITGRVIVCVLSSNVRQRVTRSLPTAARHPSPLSSFSGVPRDRVYITVDANIRMSIQNLNVFGECLDARVRGSFVVIKCIARTRAVALFVVLASFFFSSYDGRRPRNRVLPYTRPLVPWFSALRNIASPIRVITNDCVGRPFFS
jgi:hypothetical protein